jgi:hypothetical protein
MAREITKIEIIKGLATVYLATGQVVVLPREATREILQLTNLMLDVSRFKHCPPYSSGI